MGGAVVQTPGPVTLLSDAVAPDGELPRRFAWDGENVSPPLRWNDVPDATQSLALVMEDLDAGAATHWLMYDLPPDLHGLLQGPSGVGKVGRNDFAEREYRGPCPPPGASHRYCIRLYALRCASLGLPAGASRAELERALRDQVLADAQMTLRYGRPTGP
jgi:Raf kinase inhibitor-like YbhB/YbcL family protein